jgi:agmatine deiminase
MWKGNVIQLGLIQMSMSDDAESNLLHAVNGIREAARRGACIVALPELFRSVYFPQQETSVRDYREDPRDVLEVLAREAREHEVVIVTGSIYERSNGTVSGYNTSHVIDADGTILGAYRKTHIPHDPGFWEGNYFLPGDTGFRVFATRYAKIAPLICYDQWFPEAARCCVLQGAEILFYPTAIGVPLDAPQLEGMHQQAWQTVQRGHAVANSCVVAAINRCGIEGGCHFFGGSFVTDAFGKVLGEASTQATVLTVSVDLEHSRYVARGWLFQKKRRPDCYAALTSSVSEIFPISSSSD